MVIVTNKEWTSKAASRTFLFWQHLWYLENMPLSYWITKVSNSWTNGAIHNKTARHHFWVRELYGQSLQSVGQTRFLYGFEWNHALPIDTSHWPSYEPTVMIWWKRGQLKIDLGPQTITTSIRFTCNINIFQEFGTHNWFNNSCHLPVFYSPHGPMPLRMHNSHTVFHKYSKCQLII